MADYQWLTEPDFDQEGEVKRATADLADAPDVGAPLLTARFLAWQWGRASSCPRRLGALLGQTATTPLPGAADRRGGLARRRVPFDGASWPTTFLATLAGEAADGLQLRADLERAWVAARRAVTFGRRRHSRAAAALDLMAAAPLLSATTLAAALGMG